MGAVFYPEFNPKPPSDSIPENKSEASVLEFKRDKGNQELKKDFLKFRATDAFRRIRDVSSGKKKMPQMVGVGAALVLDAQDLLKKVKNSSLEDWKSNPDFFNACLDELEELFGED
jgi:hypothetical protein